MGRTSVRVGIRTSVRISGQVSGWGRTSVRMGRGDVPEKRPAKFALKNADRCPDIRTSVRVGRTGVRMAVSDAPGRGGAMVSARLSHLTCWRRLCGVS